MNQNKKNLTASQDERLARNEVRKAHAKQKRVPKPGSKKELDQVVKQLHATIQPIIDRLRIERDKLRSVLDEYQNVLECTERGCEHLEEALDTLSEQF